MNDFLYDKLESGIEELEYQIRGIRDDIEDWFLCSEPVDANIYREKVLEEGFAACPDLKELYDKLGALREQVKAFWTDDLKQKAKAEQDEMGRWDNS